MHTKGDVQKNVLCPRNHNFNGSELMSASLQQSIFRAKIAKKSHVCRDIDFAGILEGFWEGFGRPKISIFACFSMFFRSKFWKTFWKAKKSSFEGPTLEVDAFLARPDGMCGARGRDREGVRRDLGLDF